MAPIWPGWPSSSASRRTPWRAKERLLTRFRSTPSPDFSDPLEPHRVLADLELPMYITTNYDRFMIEALEAPGRSPARVVCRWNESMERKKPPKPPRFGQPVGVPPPRQRRRPAVAGHTEDDYLDFLVRSQQDEKMLPPKVKSTMASTSLLFIGYSNWPFRVLFRGIIYSIPPSQQRVHVAVQLPRRAAEEAYLQAYFKGMNVRVYWGKPGGVHEGPQGPVGSVPLTDGAVPIPAPPRPGREPFVGPEPFRREDEWRFFGRAEAVDEVFSLIQASRTLVLYAQSGTGKTSLLLNAGILPLAEDEDFDILPPARVHGLVPPGMNLADLGNPYTFFTQSGWQSDAVAGPASLTEFLRARPRADDRFGDPTQRLVIIDQFKELFTWLRVLGGPDGVRRRPGRSAGRRPPPPRGAFPTRRGVPGRPAQPFGGLFRPPAYALPTPAPGPGRGPGGSRSALSQQRVAASRRRLRPGWSTT